jgi:hypothetical protein
MNAETKTIRVLTADAFANLWNYIQLNALDPDLEGDNESTWTSPGKQQPVLS